MSSGKMAADTYRGHEPPHYAVLNLNRGSSIAARVRVAGTSSARRQGLLGISEMHGDSGIWIAPCEAIHTFGMRMPIDVLFLDREFKVRKLSSRVAAGRIRVCLAASSVLEVAQGTIARSETEVGDRLSFCLVTPNQNEE